MRATKDVYILGIETSCDESSVAIVRNGVDPIAEATASQVKLMAEYGGVVPELSARKHLEALPILFDECLRRAEEANWGAVDKLESPSAGPDSIGAVAVTVDPGLPPALATGRAYAEGVALGLGLPLIKVNHLDAHLSSVLLNDPLPDDIPDNFAKKVTYPHVSLLVSGGHTNLFLAKSPSEFELLGKTRDDAAGEAFDKVARMLGLPYPGGPEISKWAAKAEVWENDQNPFSMPLADEPFAFSFSGLKTAVRRLIVSLATDEKNKVPKDVEIEKLGSSLPEKTRAEIAYCFQEVVAATLVEKAINAEKVYQTGLVTLTGGVAANKRLRESLAKACAELHVKLKYPRINRCTDNATMVAGAGYHVLARIGRYKS